jgi:hypothetical protein
VATSVFFQPRSNKKTCEILHSLLACLANSGTWFAAKVLLVPDTAKCLTCWAGSQAVTFLIFLLRVNNKKTILVLMAVFFFFFFFFFRFA